MRAGQLWRDHPTAVVATGCVVLLLIASQILLPMIAVRVVRDRVGDPGADVTVKAFPALKMAFGNVDRVTIRAARIGQGQDDLDARLEEAGKVGEIDAEIDEIPVDGLVLRGIRARVDDGDVTASAEVELSQLEAMVPGGGGLQALPDESDGRPRFSARVTVLGVTTDVPLVVAANEGRVEVAPDLPIAGALRIPVFANDHLWIDSVSSTVDGDRIRLDVRGRLQ
ncbi:MAG: LmeA family phospholipid-binding protein [Solirubrobacteraceae bacterium]